MSIHRTVTWDAEALPREDAGARRVSERPAQARHGSSSLHALPSLVDETLDVLDELRRLVVLLRVAHPHPRPGGQAGGPGWS